MFTGFSNWIFSRKTVPLTCVIWATSWGNLFWAYVNNKGADQPAHPCSLISPLVFRCLDSIILPVSISQISSLCLASVAAQASFSLTWLQTPKTGFLVTLLIWWHLATCLRMRLPAEKLTFARLWEEKLKFLLFIFHVPSVQFKLKPLHPLDLIHPQPYPQQTKGLYQHFNLGGTSNIGEWI